MFFCHGVIIRSKEQTTLYSLKKKNGAHKHLSSSLTFSASKYSRHVVLCKNKHYYKFNKVIYVFSKSETHSIYTCWIPEIHVHENKKKNGAHKHLSSSLTFFASKYSRHVVLCKNSKYQIWRDIVAILQLLPYTTFNSSI